jgi:hypothetical protein
MLHPNPRKLMQPEKQPTAYENIGVYTSEPEKLEKHSSKE